MFLDPAAYLRLERGYSRALAAALRRRGRVLLVALGSVALGAALAGRLPLEFGGAVDRSEFEALAELPLGSGLEQTKRVGARLVEALRSVPHVRRVFLTIGADSAQSVHEARIYVELDHKRERDTSQWLADARSAAKFRVRGLSRISLRDRTTESAAGDRLRESPDGAEPLPRPRLLLREEAPDRWQVRLQLPNLAHIAARSPRSRDILTRAQGRVAGATVPILATGRIVGGNVRVQQPGFAPISAHIGFLQAHLPGADRLDLGSLEHQAGLVFLKYEKIVGRLAVSRKYFLADWSFFAHAGRILAWKLFAY